MSFKSLLTAKINGVEINNLVDTGSSESFISADIAKRNRFKIIHCNAR